jgi:hypothetical protein
MGPQVPSVDTAEIVVADRLHTSIDEDRRYTVRRRFDRICWFQKSCTHRGGRDVNGDLARNDRGCNESKASIEGSEFTLGPTSALAAR